MNASAQPIPGPARVLIVTDRPVLAEGIERALAQGGYPTRVAGATAAVAAALGEWQPHLAVVDLDAPNGSPLDRLASPTPSGERFPIVALTRCGDLAARLAAFDRGVDDVLTVPFSPAELRARIAAVVRRAYRGAVPATPVLRLGELEIDVLHRSVRAGGRELRLTALDQGLLYLLAANVGRIVTRDEILDRLWGVDFVAESNVVDRHVRTLRAKLHDDWRRPRYIATVPGRGYRFMPALPKETPRLADRGRSRQGTARVG